MRRLDGITLAMAILQQTHKMLGQATIEAVMLLLAALAQGNSQNATALFQCGAVRPLLLTLQEESGGKALLQAHHTPYVSDLNLDISTECKNVHPWQLLHELLKPALCCRCKNV